MLCQFTPNRSERTEREEGQTLADFGTFPKDVYPVGRLDKDSEGLVMLTNDGALKHRLLEPRFEHPRTYLVQVERIPTSDVLERLRKGIVIEGKRTKPAEVLLLQDEPVVFSRRPVPIRYRKNVPTAWLEITLREGRNRQVRKMTAAVGHPTLRLIRVGMGRIRLGNLQPGEKRELSTEELAFILGGKR